MAKFVGFIVGAVEIGVGIITANPMLVVSGAMMIVSSAASQPKSKQQARQAAVTTLQIGEVSRQAGVGELAIAGSLAGAFNYGGKYGTDWEVLGIAALDHECEALLGFWVNDAYVAYTGDGPVAGYNGQLEVYWRSGALGQDLPAVATSTGYWDAADVGEGVAKVFFAYKADEADAKNPVWTSGRPSFLLHLKGAKCYAPRKDGTLPGGSGTHRADDPSTWEWTENAIDCRYNWVRGFYAGNRVDDPTMLLVGRGLGPIEAPPVNTFAPANLCDELVGGEARYRVGGTIGADQTFSDVEDMFALACGGVITQIDGSVEIEPGHAKAPVAFITDADLIVGEKVQGRDFLSRASDEWVNTIVPRYNEPAQKWADHGAAIRRVDADVVADRGPREQTLTLSLVHWATQAGRVGEIARRLGRLWKRYAIPLGPRFRALEAGDWIVWTSARRFKGESVTFRVDAASRQKGRNALQLRQINASVFTEGDFIADQAVVLNPDAPPAIGQPGVGAWAVSAVLLGTGSGVTPALMIAGAADDSYAQTIVFEYWKNDGVTPVATVAAADWSLGMSAPRTQTHVYLTSVAPGAGYYASVTYMIGDRRGDRRILGPVTIGAPVSLADVNGGLIDSGAGGVTVPRSGVLNSFDTMTAGGTFTNGAGGSYAITALPAGNAVYTGGVTVQALKPAEASATAGATSGINIKRSDGTLATGDSVIFNDNIGVSGGRFTNVSSSAAAVYVDNSLGSMTAAGTFTNGAGGSYSITALPAGNAVYTGGATVQSLKPAEASATVGATSGVNIKRASGAVASGDSVIFNDNIGVSAGRFTNVSTAAAAVYVDNSLGSMTAAGTFTNGAGGSYTITALPAGNAVYTGGATVDSLKPAEASATVGATSGVNIKRASGAVASGDSAIFNDNIGVSAGRFTNVSTAAAAVYVDNSLGSMTAAGTFTNGAGGSYSITALDFDNTAGTNKPANGATVGRNLVRNPGGESGSVSPWAIDTTNVGGGGISAFTADSSTSYAGKYALKLAKAATGDTGSVGHPAFPVNPAKTYLVRGYLKGSAASANGNYIQMWEKNAAPTGSGIVVASGANAYTSIVNVINNVAATTGFVKWEALYTPTAGTTWASIVLVSFTNAPTGVWWDEVEFYELSDADFGATVGATSGVNIKRASGAVASGDSVIFNDNIGVSGGRFTNVGTAAAAVYVDNSLGSMTAAGTFTNGAGGSYPITALPASNAVYTGGATVDSLKPAEAAATVGATSGVNIKRASGAVASGDSVIFNDNIGVSGGRFTNVGTSAAAVYVDNSLGSMTSAGVFSNGAGGSYSITALDFDNTAGTNKPANGATPGRNLVRNPGGESSVVAPWAIDTTNVGGGGISAFTADSTTAYAGKYALKLAKAATSDIGSVGHPAFPVSPGKTYLVRGYLKGSAASANGNYIQMWEKNAAPTGSGIIVVTGANAYTSIVTVINNVAATTGFVKWEGFYTPSAGITHASLVLVSFTNSPTGVWWDEVEFYELSDAEYNADVTYTLSGPPTSSVDANSDGTFASGVLPVTVGLSLTTKAGDVTVSSGATYAVAVESGSATASMSVGTTKAILSVSALGADTVFKITATIGGVVRDTFRHRMSKVLAQNAVGASTGGGGATGSSAPISGNIASSTAYTDVTGSITAVSGTNGTITLDAPARFRITSNTPNTYTAQGKWQWNNGGTWTDVGTATADQVDAVVTDEGGGTYTRQYGTLTVSASQTGLGAGVSRSYRFVVSDGSGSVTYSWSGSSNATATGS